MTARPRRKHLRRDVFSAKTEPVPNGNMIWHVLGPLDELARRMEQKWGIERLPCLVSEGTASRFGAAREHLDALLEANENGDGDLAKIQDACENLRRGWEALDREATAAGATPFDPIGWSLMAGDQQVVIVRDPAAAAHIQKLKPDQTVYTLEEVGNLIAAAVGEIAPTLAKAKQTFPGATVATIRPRTKLEAELDDEIPF